MKPIYHELQHFAFELCILFGISPYMPSFLQKNFDGETAAMYSWGLFLISTTIFLLCLWWMKADWDVEKPGYMIALSFGSALGAMIGFSALIGLYGHSTRFYLLWRDTPALVLGVAMIGGVAIEFLRPKLPENGKG
jgi:apolipoprotein N-acyltransferase